MDTLPVFLLLSILILGHASGEIQNVEISSDSRSTILFERFGFTHTGEANISVSSVSVIFSSSFTSYNASQFGFFLLSDESLVQVLIELQQTPFFCLLDSAFINLLFTFSDLSPPPSSSFEKFFPIPSPSEYSLFFANCAPESKVSMNLRIELYNQDDAGKGRDYLSAGLAQLPSLFLCFSFLYSAFFAFWIYNCFKNKKSHHRIHSLMGLLVITTALNLLSAAVAKHYVKVTGTQQGWNVLFYIFQFIRSVLLFTLIVLIGSGWSLKPFLQNREKNVLMIVIALQVVANLASVVIGETGPYIKDWVTLNQVFLLADFICCCAIIFPIVWSIRSSREASKTDRKSAGNLAKLSLFWRFFIVVICYLLFTRIFVVFALRTIAMAKAAEEIAGFTFYCVIFYMLRPKEKNDYFVLDEEEEEAAKFPLLDDKSEL